MPIEAVYSSPRKRALLTAQIIAVPHDLDVIIEEGLAEPWLGKLEGMYKHDIHELIDERLNALTREERTNTGHFPGLTSPNMTAMHAEEALENMGKQHPGQTVIAISHSGIVESILASRTDAIYESIKMTNMAFLKFVYDSKTLELKEVSPDIAYECYETTKLNSI